MTAGGGAAVEGLVLHLGGGGVRMGVGRGDGRKRRGTDVVFGAAMAVAGAAAVEVPVGACTGAADASLGGAADVDVGD